MLCCLLLEKKPVLFQSNDTYWLRPLTEFVLILKEQRMQHDEQDMLTRPENLVLPSCFGGFSVAKVFFLFSCYICKTFVCLLIFLNFLQYRCQFLFDLWVSINVPLVSAPLFCSRLLYTKIVYPVHESSHRIQVVRDWVNMISCFTTPHKAIESKELFLV